MAAWQKSKFTSILFWFCFAVVILGAVSFAVDFLMILKCSSSLIEARNFRRKVRGKDFGVLESVKKLHIPCCVRLLKDMECRCLFKSIAQMSSTKIINIITQDRPVLRLHTYGDKMLNNLWLKGIGMIYINLMRKWCHLLNARMNFECLSWLHVCVWHWWIIPIHFKCFSLSCPNGLYGNIK